MIRRDAFRYLLRCLTGSAGDARLAEAIAKVIGASVTADGTEIVGNIRPVCSAVSESERAEWVAEFRDSVFAPIFREHVVKLRQQEKREAEADRLLDLRDEYPESADMLTAAARSIRGKGGVCD